MNKGRRQELKLLKFKNRLSKWGLKESPASNLHAFRSHGCPCSCALCRDKKYRSKRKTVLQKAFREVSKLI